MIGWLIIASWDWGMMREKVIKMEKERYRILEQMEVVDAEDKPFEVKKYDYFLWIHPRKKLFSVHIIVSAYNKIKFLALDFTDSVWVHFVNEVNGDTVYTIDSIIFEKGVIRWPIEEYYKDGDRLIIRTGMDLHPGEEFYITIYYREDGSVHDIEGAEGPICFLSQPYYNRKWLPLYDRYYEKVDTVIATFKVPKEFIVVSNGVKVFDTTDGIYRYIRWVESYPIAPYLIAFWISRNAREYRSLWSYGDVTMPIFLWVDSLESWPWINLPPDTMLKIIKFNLTIASDVFGIYPFYREKYGEVNACVSMEYQTVPFDPVSLHEMLHQWWGDWVTAATHYGDVWLNEGFTSYFTGVLMLLDSYRNSPYSPYAYDSIIVIPCTSYREMTERSMQTYLEWSDVNKPIYGSGFEHAYDKGSLVLHMIRMTMRQMVGDSVAGDSLFFDAIRYYGNRHAYSNASTEDFKNDLEEFTGWDWDTFFLQWVYTPGHPIFDVRWRKWESGGMWNMEIVMNQIQDSSWMYYRMKYPIRIGLEGNEVIDTVVELRGVPSDTFYFSFVYEPMGIELDPEEYFIEQVASIVEEGEGGIEGVRYGVWREGDRIIVRAPNRGDYRVEIYDISGRLRVSKNVREEEVININMPTGVYIYRLIGGDGKTLRGKFLY